MDLFDADVRRELFERFVADAFDLAQRADVVKRAVLFPIRNDARGNRLPDARQRDELFARGRIDVDARRCRGFPICRDGRRRNFRHGRDDIRLDRLLGIDDAEGRKRAAHREKNEQKQDLLRPRLHFSPPPVEAF